MTWKIVIQPDLSVKLSHAGFRLRVSGGEIVQAQGLGGLTQSEDSASILLASPETLHWRGFLWTHYSTLLVHISGSSDTILRIEGHPDACDLLLEELTPAATRLVTAPDEAIMVATYDPQPVGQLSISPDNVEAGECRRFVIGHTVGERGIRTGGAIRILTPFSSWSPPSLSDYTVQVESSRNVTVHCDLAEFPQRIFGSVYTITVLEGELVEGDVVRLHYDSGTDGIRVQTYAKQPVYFPVSVDSLGRGIFYPVPLSNSPRVTVKSGPASGIRLAAPMVSTAGETFDVRAILLDQHCNPAAGTSPCDLTLSVYLEERGLSETSVRIEPGKTGSHSLSLQEEGWYVLTAEVPGLESSQIVIRCVRDPGYPRLYWGAIHGHTDMSDGEFDPEEYFAYGRDVGLLDFCSVADHDWELIEHERSRRRGGFSYIEELTRKFQEPGRYVTITAYEWMSPEGHINVYYDNDLIGNPVYIGNVSIVDRVESPTVERLIELCKDRDDVLLIPHSSHGLAWRSFDPHLMPVVEMYSCWGNSEYRLGSIGSGANEGLKRGYRFGFIGGADSHHGSPGHTGSPSKYDCLPCREGFAAVYAADLTRKSIFDSLRRRHCYATTAARILLEFEVNGVFMGGELKVEEGEVLVFRGQAGGTSAIKRLELIRNGEVSYSSSGSGLIERFRHETPAEPGTHYFYLRVTQSDGEMAWSSPVWVMAR